MKRIINTLACIWLLAITSSYAQFVHPGLSHKLSDLDRMKYQVNAGIEPWKSSFDALKSNSDASYNYKVYGATYNDSAGTTYRDYSLSAMQKDAQAAYYNAIQWYVTGDTRYADKAVEVFKAWSTIRNIASDVIPLNGGKPLWRMLEAAEIIKATYSGWALADINKFKEMLVYPGWSGTTVPSGDKSFYWNIYNGDRARHGNQGLFAFRSVMAMGVFLDNELIYNRALRYLQGMPHASNDLPYPSGPPITTPSPNTSNEFYDEFNVTSFSSTVPDYGYNELIKNYIWESGQSQESSRDQAHAIGGVSIISTMCEIAWNQGDDLYSFLDNRVLKGIEYAYRYNLSFTHSFPDQLSPWEPTVASGEFIERTDRSGRWKSLKINPYVGSSINDNAFLTRGGQDNIPLPQMILGHYRDRIELDENKYKWVKRGDDLAFLDRGYEGSGTYTDHPSYGHLTFHRVDKAPGDPINGFTNTLPTYAMNVLPMTIEAENFDYSPINGNGRTYFDDGAGNRGNQYRTTEDADIDICTEGGYNLGWLTPGEWYTYTVYVPETKTYDIAVRYSANNNNGKIKFSFGGADKTSEVTLVSTAGWQNWQSQTIAQGVLLSKGVQSLRVFIAGTGTSFNLNNFTISNSTFCAAPDVEATNSASNLKAGLAYDYYEGTWTTLPNFNALTSLQSGTSATVKIGNTTEPANFGYDFKGYIQIKTEGTYTFYTSSDDGSSLSISGAKIVNNDGKHGVVEASGSICLQKGYHPINVNYFNGGGGKALSVSYSGPSISKKTLADLYYLPDGIILANESILEDQLLVYPNPISNTIHIDFGSLPISKIELLNTLGQVLISEEQEISGSTYLPGHNLNAGMYILKITSGNELITKTILKK